MLKIYESSGRTASLDRLYYRLMLKVYERADGPQVYIDYTIYTGTGGAQKLLPEYLQA